MTPFSRSRRAFRVPRSVRGLVSRTTESAIAVIHSRNAGTNQNRKPRELGVPKVATKLDRVLFKSRARGARGGLEKMVRHPTILETVGGRRDEHGRSLSPLV